MNWAQLTNKGPGGSVFIERLSALLPQNQPVRFHWLAIYPVASRYQSLHLLFLEN